ncbi:MAG TPA: RNA methyltransferase [Acidimicrobiia bacterium]|nr:RNA methyltransferase [Acidimicrobiia bacterium]
MAPAGYGGSVEGVHAVAAAIAAGRVEKLFVERGRRGRLEGIISAVDDSMINLVDEVRSLAETDAPQGVVARCRPIRPVALETLAVESAAVLVLDHVEDPHNVGAVARSARAAGMTGLVVASRRAAPLSAAAFKAAAGALEHLPVAVVGSIPEALSRLKGDGLWIVGLDMGGDQSLFDLNLLTEPLAVVIGAEGSGLAELTRRRCHVLASIPMARPAESLNASVSAALASFEIMRVRTPR